MTKLYVVARPGRYLKGFGNRLYGESFDLPDDMARELAQRDDFALSDPNVTKARPKPETKDVVPEETTEKEKDKK